MNHPAIQSVYRPATKSLEILCFMFPTRELTKLDQISSISRLESDSLVDVALNEEPTELDQLSQMSKLAPGLLFDLGTESSAPRENTEALKT